MSMLSEDALRKAYDDRIRHLGRKLGNSSCLLPGEASGSEQSSSSTVERSHRRSRSVGARCGRVGGGQQFGHSKESADLDCQIETLVQKISSLCQERRAIRKQFDEADRRHTAVVVDLRARLSEAQVQYKKLAKERADLQEQLAHSAGQSKGPLSSVQSEKLHSLQANVEALNHACCLVSEHLARVQEEAVDYRNKVATLSVEAANIYESGIATNAEQAATRLEIEELWRRVRQSETERQELEDKYLLVGSRFKKITEAAELESNDAAKILKSQSHNLQKKAEKQRRRAESARKRLDELQRISLQQRETLRERDADISKLRDVYADRRMVAQRMDEQYHEEQRRILQTQAEDLQKLSSMMPAAAHHKILAEQSDYYQACLRDFENAICERLRLQEERSKQQLWEQEFRDNVLDQQRSRLQEQLLILQEREQEHQHLWEKKLLQDDAGSRCESLELQIRDVESEIFRTEAVVASMDEQRRSVAGALEGATQQLGQMRKLLEVERKRRDSAKGKLEDVQAGLASIRQAVVKVDAQLAEAHKMNALAKADAQLRENILASSTEIAKLRSDISTAEADLPAVFKAISDLEQRVVIASRTLQNKKNVIMRLQATLRAYGEQERCALGALRKHVQKAGTKFLRDLQESIGRRSKFPTLERKHITASLESVEAKMEACKELSRQVETLLVDVSSARDKLASARTDSAHCTAQCSQLELASRRVALDGEQVLRTLQAAMPHGLSDTSFNAMLALVGGSAGCEDSHLRALNEFKAELRRNLEAAGEEGARAEQARWASMTAEQKVATEVSEGAFRTATQKRREHFEQESAKLESELRQLAAAFVPAGVVAPREDDGEPTGVGGLLPGKDADGLVDDPGQLKQLREVVAEAEARAGALERQVHEAHLLMEQSALEVSVAVEAAERRAKSSLEAEVREGVITLAALRQRHEAEVRRFEAEWGQHADRLQQYCTSEEHHLKTILIEEVRMQRQELTRIEDATKVSLQARANTLERLEEEFAMSSKSLEDAESELRQLRSLRDSRKRTTKHIEESIGRFDRRIADALEGRKRDEQEAAEDERQLLDLHNEAVARLRRQRDGEISRLELLMHQSLSTLSAELSTDSDAALQQHSLLSASAERLAERARRRLEADRKPPLGHTLGNSTAAVAGA